MWTGSDLEDVCFSDYSASSTNTVYVDVIPFGDALTQMALRRSGDEHHVGALPVGCDEPAVVYGFPSGDTMTQKALLRSDDDEPAVRGGKADFDCLLSTPRFSASLVDDSQLCDDPVAATCWALPIWSAEPLALLRPGDEPADRGGDAHFLLEILDLDDTPFRVFEYTTVKLARSVKYVVGHSDAGFRVRLTIRPEAWRVYPRVSVHAVLWVDGARIGHCLLKNRRAGSGM